MRIKIIFFSAIFFFSLLFVQGFCEEITLTTYYPAPYGVYKSLRLYPNNGPPSCDADHEGVLHYDNGQGSLQRGFYYCSQDPVSLGFGWQRGSGYWMLVSNPYPVPDYLNLNVPETNTRVGIGTFTPEQQLSITGNFQLPVSANVGGNISGVIYSGANRFIHNLGHINDTSNTFIGVDAGKLNLDQSQAGTKNTGLGAGTLSALTNGTDNTAVGYAVLAANQGGNLNTGVGAFALNSNSAGAANTAIGYYALKTNTLGQNNTAIGYNALRDNTEGDNNIANGSEALRTNTLGNFNIAMGVQALFDNTTGENNVAIGTSALGNNTLSNENTAIGKGALQSYEGNASTQGKNTAIGSQAGNMNQTGIGNVFLGYQAGANAGAGGNVSDRLYIANSDIDPPLIYGDFNTSRIGLGTITPSEKLQVTNGNIYIETAGNGLILKSPNGTVCKKLTIDNAGATALVQVNCP
ncbi:MAG: hypothetical protein Q8O13_10100 [Candidatus Omnitrophota bacterium]|nr:hypothetical protein [Candidatus Omnitrophota bacterium]